MHRILVASCPLAERTGEWGRIFCRVHIARSTTFARTSRRVVHQHVLSVIHGADIIERYFDLPHITLLSKFCTVTRQYMPPKSHKSQMPCTSRRQRFYISNRIRPFSNRVTVQSCPEARSNTRAKSSAAHRAVGPSRASWCRARCDTWARAR